MQVPTEAAKLDYNKTFSLMNKWHSLYPNVLQGLEMLYAAHESEEQNKEITELFENLINE